MEIRPIEKAEFTELLRLYAFSFHNPSDLTIPEDAEQKYKDTFGLFDGGALRAAMTVHGHRMFFEGASIPVAGIGGVATFPEYRRNGCIRELFSVLFPRMRENGQAFSSLYPFSFPYYRAFGYESAYSRSTWKLPLSALNPRTEGGSIELLTSPTEEAESLYRDFASSRNLAMDRGKSVWRKSVHAEPHKDQDFFYLCRNPEGTPEAYFRFKAVPRGRHNIDIEALDLAWRGSAGLSAVLGRLAQFAPRAVDLTVNLPPDVALDQRIADPYVIERRSYAGFMVRVIDAEAALNATRFPGSGSIVIKVIDDRLDWNAGRFRIEWTDGWTEATRTSQEPALVLDIRTLAQLLVGYIGGADAVDHGLSETTLSRERLAAIFPRKALYQNDHF